MEIICKCGHPAFNHEDYRQVDKVAQCLDFPCNCKLTEREVYQIHITELSARLDTNRAQAKALIAENDKLREINAHTWCAYCEKVYERTDDTLEQIREHISVCEKHPMRKVEAERDAAVSELNERRENFTVMLNRLLEAEQKHAETRAQLNYVLADNAQLRAVLVQFLELANSEGLAKDFQKIIEKLQIGLNIMGDPRENHD